MRYRRDGGIDKVSTRQVDWYMNNLLKRPDIGVVWVCVEPVHLFICFYDIKKPSKRGL